VLVLQMLHLIQKDQLDQVSNQLSQELLEQQKLDLKEERFKLNEDLR
jgi:hypothetical protein